MAAGDGHGRWTLDMEMALQNARRVLAARVADLPIAALAPANLQFTNPVIVIASRRVASVRRVSSHAFVCFTSAAHTEVQYTIHIHTAVSNHWQWALLISKTGRNCL